MATAAAEQDAPTPSGPELLAMIQHLPDVLFRCEMGSDGRIYWTFNEGKLAEEFHLTTAEVQGKSLDDLFPGPGNAAVRENFEEAFAGRPTDFINEIGGRYFRHHPQPVYDDQGNVTAVVGFITEVTEAVQAQAVVKELNAEMMHRVLELNEANEALRAANADLERANQDLDAFAFTVSHDLRAPLTAINNFAYVLGAKYGKTLGDDGVAKVQRIRGAVERMDHLILDILRFSRASRCGLEREEVDLSAAARVFAAEHATEGRKVEWHIEDGLKVRGDPSLLRVVVENLLGNAWKYSSQEPVARIRVGRASTPRGTAFFVEDNGIGFGSEGASQVFDAFGRLTNAQGFQGTGIGLATVRRIVERHGGQVWAESPDKGARLLFTLPD